MKAHLLYRDRDFDPQSREAGPANATALTQDLALETLFTAMAGGNQFFLDVARPAILSAAAHADVDTILYRQAVLQDCLRNHPIVESIYALAVETLERKRQHWFGIFGTHPGSVLYGAVQLLQMMVEMLGRLRRIADEHANAFTSEGFRTFFAMLQRELSDDYFTTVKAHLKELQFRRGVLISAELGRGNEGKHHVLCRLPEKKPAWLPDFLVPAPRGLTFRIAERDDAGARALGELRDRGINLAANAAAQASDHILSFFVMLMTELAFYLGCMNLHQRLQELGLPVCFPVPEQAGASRFACAGLSDACLALSMERSVVVNDVDADGKRLIVITGANQGGKSTFLRSVGVAQLMMQAGMFVAADSFRASVCRGLFTHYKREEDAALKSGKFDEELGRMSGIIDALTPDSLLLFNESFAATNEREGSEIARQIVTALLSARVKVFYVTHLYEFAHRLWSDHRDDALFLRADRQPDGTRTFKLGAGEPLETSYGVDLYKKIFAGAAVSDEPG